MVYVLDENTQKFTGIIPPLTDEDILTSSIFEGLQMDLAEVFPVEEIV